MIINDNKLVMKKVVIDDKIYLSLEGEGVDKMDINELSELIQQGFTNLENQMNKGFKEVNDKITKLENRVDGLETHVKKNDVKLEDLEKKIDLSLEGQTNNTEQLNRIEKQVSKHEEFIIKRIV